MSASAADKALLTRAERAVTVSADTTGYAAPRRIVRPTALQSAAAATAVGQHVLAVENVGGRSQVRLELAGVNWPYRLGDTITLDLPRFGLDNFAGLVIGLQRSYSADLATTSYTLEIKA